MKLTNTTNEPVVYSKMSLDRSGSSPPSTTNIYFILQLISLGGFLISLFSLPPTHGEETIALWDLAMPVLCSSFLTIAGVATFLAVRREFEAAVFIWRGVFGVRPQVHRGEHYLSSNDPREQREGTIANLGKGSKLWIVLFAAASLNVVLLAMTAPAIAILISSNPRSSSCVGTVFRFLSMVLTKTTVAFTVVATWTFERTMTSLSKVLEINQQLFQEMMKRFELTEGLSAVDGLSSDHSVTADIEWHLQNVASLLRQFTSTASDSTMWKTSKTVMYWFFLLGEKVVNTKPHIVGWSVSVGIVTCDYLKEISHMFADDVAPELIQSLILTFAVVGLIEAIIGRNVFHKFSREFGLSCWVTIGFHILSIHSTAYICAESAMYFSRQQGWTHGSHIPTRTLQYMLTFVSAVCGFLIGARKPPSDSRPIKLVPTDFTDIMSSTFNSSILLTHGSEEILAASLNARMEDTSRSSESMSSMAITTKSRPPSAREPIREEQDGDLCEEEEDFSEDPVSQCQGGGEQVENDLQSPSDDEEENALVHGLRRNQSSSERSFESKDEEVEPERPKSSTDIEDDNEPTTTSDETKVDETLLQQPMVFKLDEDDGASEASASNLSSDSEDLDCQRRTAGSSSCCSESVEGTGQRSARQPPTSPRQGTGRQPPTSPRQGTGRQPPTSPLLKNQLKGAKTFVSSHGAFCAQSASGGVRSSTFMCTGDKQLLGNHPKSTAHTAGAANLPNTTRPENQPVMGLRRARYETENVAPIQTNGLVRKSMPGKMQQPATKVISSKRISGGK